MQAHKSAVRSALSYVERGFGRARKGKVGCGGYLRGRARVREVPLKILHESTSEVVRKPLDDYLSEFEAHEGCSSGETAQESAYLHDIPLTALLPKAADDLEHFPADDFPAWYRNNWVNFAQVFLGPAHSLTPLHFDCLLTHNLFFQIKGRKRFILIPAEHLKFCYRHSWRWCEVNAEKPDWARFPLYAQAQPFEVIVDPGDRLFARVSSERDATLAELQAWLLTEHNMKVSVSRLWNSLRRL